MPTFLERRAERDHRGAQEGHDGGRDERGAENLPPNLLEVARRLWDEGRFQEALGLLYRGAISSLVTRRVVEIEESDTEMDCLRRVTSKGEAANASYFQLLTGAWMSQAYARRQPNDDTIEQLWSRWPFQERRGA